MRELGLGEMVRKGNVRRTILAALHDMGMKEPFDLDIPEEKAQALRMRQFSALSEEEENSLEEFSWAFGPAAVREIEGSVDYVLKQIHGISDIELLAKEGLEEKLKYWHSLGPLDEDELLRRLELHIQDLPEEVKEKSSLAIGLIENRRRMLRGKLLKEHPEILEHLKK